MSTNDVLLEVDDLKKHFKVNEGWIASLLQSVSGDDPDYVHAVDGVSFELRKGETLGLAGESGCGKTTTGMSMVKLHEPTAGDIVYNDQNLPEAHVEHRHRFVGDDEVWVEHQRPGDGDPLALTAR